MVASVKVGEWFRPIGTRGHEAVARKVSQVCKLGQRFWFDGDGDKAPYRLAIDYCAAEAPKGVSATAPHVITGTVPLERAGAWDVLGDQPCAETIEKLNAATTPANYEDKLQVAQDAFEPNLAYLEHVASFEDVIIGPAPIVVPKDTNPKTIYGQAKSPLGLVPGTAMVMMSEALRDGSDKYGPANWRVDPVSSSTYRDACLRHLFAWIDGEDVDPQSGVPHLAHAMTNIAIILDAAACGTLLDDRPTKAPTGDLIRAKMRKL